MAYLQERRDPVFFDRAEAGRVLAEELVQYKDIHPLILALPRGGVPVAEAVAKRLNAPLDVLLVRKIGAPSNPEFAIGAISENKAIVLDTKTIEVLGVTKDELHEIVTDETEEMQRRKKFYRNNKSLPSLSEQTVIIVDDGLATGMTAQAAIKAARSLGTKKIVFAAPVCAKESALMLEEDADEVICSVSPISMGAVGLFYERFEQVRDEEVREILDHYSAKNPSYHD